ncbi:hypothetical protein [Jatrophihabitans sp. GAS493]|uniref:hypothetical protein n=1 Tax=Jatrophihabitans sp. GAS493 TaxID=1907575 RepID=UPI0015617421|nr:hypothetical protein [Jatrophihabitans sp. GAS493]
MGGTPRDETDDGAAVRVPSFADAVMFPDGVAAWLASHEPGPETGALLGVLDPERLTHAGRVDLLVAVRRQQAWFAATEAGLLASISAHAAELSPVPELAFEAAEADVSCALQIPPRTAGFALDHAVTLVNRIPTTHRLLLEGRTTLRHAMTLTVPSPTSATTGSPPRSRTRCYRRWGIRRRPSSPAPSAAPSPSSTRPQIRNATKTR